MPVLGHPSLRWEFSAHKGQALKYAGFDVNGNPTYLSGVSSEEVEELIRDVIGTILVDTNSIDFTYDDINDEIFADLRIQDSLTTDLSIDSSGLKVDVLDNTSNQKTRVSKTGILIGTRREINLIEGSNVTLTVADNSGSDRVDITIGGTVSGYSDEQAQDAVGGILIDTDHVQFTYDDSANTIEATTSYARIFMMMGS